MRSVFENFPEVKLTLSPKEKIIESEKNISLDIVAANKNINILETEELETISVNRQESIDLQPEENNLI